MAMVDTNLRLDVGHFPDLGYTVDIAYEGRGALELSEGHQYSLALLDYNMPGMDGLELCRRLKISQPSIVVAIITAFASVATTRVAAEAGVSCSFLKPVNFLALMSLVKGVIIKAVDNTSVEIGTAAA